MRTVCRLFLLLFLFYNSITSFGQHTKTINPLDFGLLEAKTGIERYEVLKRCHEEAFKYGLNVSYKGIDSVFVEIPKNPQSLRLTEQTDFAGVVMTVLNNSKSMTLFYMTQDAHEIIISGEEIDRGDFTTNAILKKGVKLLSIRDEKDWIPERLGYNDSNGYKRSDVLLLKNGIAQNKTIMPYGNEFSIPKAYYSDVSTKKKKVNNIVFIRNANSKFRTDFIDIRRQYNVELNKITIYTPEDDTSFNDGAIFISGCSNVTLKDLKIYGTYSQHNLSGYGVRAVNVHNLKVIRMFARAKWGVFGNNAINGATLRDCDINRFDVHYYGKDIKIKNSKFSSLYNQFSSMYGNIVFDHCEFRDFIPFLNESSFNAFTPYELEWKNCIFYLDKKHNFLFAIGGVPNELNIRPELLNKRLPNIKVLNCRVVLADDVSEWYLIKTGDIRYDGDFDYLSDIKIKGVIVENGREKSFKVMNNNIKTIHPIRTIIKQKQK